MIPSRKTRTEFAAYRAFKGSVIVVSHDRYFLNQYKEERELESIEAEIHAAEAEVARLEALLSAPDFYAKHGNDWPEFEA